MSSIVISGYYGFGNAGDEAVLAAMIQALRRVEPRIYLTVLSARPEETARQYNVAAVSRTKARAIWRAIAAADLLISGGGSLLQDVTGNGSIPYYLGIVWMAQLLGKPVFFYAQGVGPVRKWTGRLLVRGVVNRVEAVTVRDGESAAELRRLGVTRPPVTVTADPVFGLESHTQTASRLATAGSGPVIGVAAREWPEGDHGAGGYADDYKELIARACAHLAERYGARIILLPFHQPDDLRIARELQEKIGPAAEVAGEGMPPLELAGMVAGLDFLIGMRLHALIFAALAGVPFAGIAYDPKVTALLALFGQKPVLKVSAGSNGVLDSDLFIRELVQRWEEREEIRKKAREEVYRPGGLRDRALATARMALATIRPAVRPSVVQTQNQAPVQSNASGNEPRRVEILGVRVDDLGMKEALARIEGFIKSGRPHQVVTVNPEMVMRSRQDPEFAAILREAALITADGVGIVWAARQLYSQPGKLPGGLAGRPPGEPESKANPSHGPLEGRITGVELTAALLQLAAAKGYRVFLLGAAEGVAERAASRVTAAYPGLKVAGVQEGYFRPEEEPAVVRKIFQAQPEILLVGLGSPRQEKWIRHHLHELGVPVCIGVGGTLDILAGTARRAPAWMRRAGLEWLYRLWRQPARIWRMLAIPRFMAAVLAERLRRGTGVR